MLIGVIVIIATVAATLLLYAGTRSVLGRESEDRTRDLAHSVLFRTSALHGLVLALVFASEVVEYHQLDYEMAVEVNAVSDLYYDAERYGEAAMPIRTALRDYVMAVATEEWALLDDKSELLPAAWRDWSTIYEAVLTLEPATMRQTDLRANMLKKIHIIAESRDMREYHAKTGLSLVFWIAALSGLLLISACYYTFPPKRENVALLSIFGAYNGLILLTIFAMSNPFGDPVALEPVLFEDLLTEISG